MDCFSKWTTRAMIHDPNVPPPFVVETETDHLWLSPRTLVSTCGRDPSSSVVSPARCLHSGLVVSQGRPSPRTRLTPSSVSRAPFVPSVWCRGDDVPYVFGSSTPFLLFPVDPSEAPRMKVRPGFLLRGVSTVPKAVCPDKPLGQTRRDPSPWPCPTLVSVPPPPSLCKFLSLYTWSVC